MNKNEYHLFYNSGKIDYDLIKFFQKTDIKYVLYNNISKNRYELYVKTSTDKNIIKKIKLIFFARYELVYELKWPFVRVDKCKLLIHQLHENKESISFEEIKTVIYDWIDTNNLENEVIVYNDTVFFEKNDILTLFKLKFV